MTGTIRVVLIDDQIIARYGLRMMLQPYSDLRVAGEADHAGAALKLLRSEAFDVALLDITLPDKNGLDLLKILREEFPAMAVLVISAHSEDTYALRALKLGAAGYLTKSCTPDEVAAAVRKLAAGGKYVTPSLLQKLAGMLGDSNKVAPHETLTERELQIFCLIAKGESLVNIAAILHLSPSTVTSYRARILEKTRLRSNADLVRYALDHGLA
jgi:DNA-binding NarL/FixJ family response regulator